MNHTAHLTDIERTILLDAADKVFYPSYYKFIHTHKGFRPGSIHFFLGTAGGGKSTLARSLICDSLLHLPHDEKMLLWLSEESRLDFLTEFHRTGFKSSKLKNLIIVSELDLDAKHTQSPQAIKDFMSQFCREQEINFLFYDNITTSALYMDLHPSQQSDNAKWLKNLASDLEIPIVIFGHTDGKVNDNLPRLIDMNDIRGSKSIVNLAQFFYIMQRFIIDENIYPTIRITKHRGQEVGHKLFRLHYEKRSRIYSEDQQMSFDTFKLHFQQRSKL